MKYPASLVLGTVVLACFRLPSSVLSAESAVQVHVDLRQPAKPISPDLVGIFFEDLNYAADGGLYAELIQNRSFEYSATEQADWGPFTAWELVRTGDGDGNLGLGDARPVHVNNPHYLLLNVLTPGGGVGIANRGFDQIPVVAGEPYDASLWAYQTFMGRKWSGPRVDQSKPMPVTMRLEAGDGSVLAEARLEVSGRAWRNYSVTLVPARTEPAARFVVLAHEQGGLAIDMVSLFPRATFKERSNGLRRDLAQAIADLRPKFMRFPGGCLVHGPGIRHDYDWKASVGPVEQRRAQRNSWGYHQTLGLGYFEYFQFCEDIGAKPLPVVSAGVCCQHAGDSPGRGQEGLPLEEMPAYIQDILDLVEWANGPATSPWGAVRAAAGHPEPFGLKYLGVGNEDAITPIFKERFAMIADALQRHHPEIVVIGTSGPFASGEDFDNGWAFARERQLALVDEHYYVSPQWFWDNLTRYDSYDRRGPKVYLGEYAAHEQDRRNTLRTAIAEAACLTSLERNGDVVMLASYAPLLARRQHTQWVPDMIYFDATHVYPTANYAVQRLFGEHRGDRLLGTSIEGLPAGAKLAVSAVQAGQEGEIILKIVNGEGAAMPVSVEISGMRTPPMVAQRIVFGGVDADTVPGDATDLSRILLEETGPLSSPLPYQAPANSLSILRFGAR